MRCKVLHCQEIPWCSQNICHLVVQFIRLFDILPPTCPPLPSVYVICWPILKYFMAWLGTLTHLQLWQDIILPAVVRNIRYIVRDLPVDKRIHKYLTIFFSNT